MATKGSADITQIYERNQEATVYAGNLDGKVDEELLWELFVQCGPIRNVHIPRDKITSQHSSYGFVEYDNEIDAEYAMKIINMVKLNGKPIRCNKASQDKRTQEVGANLFIGNLDSDVDEKLLYDTFSSFGIILSAKVMRNTETGESKGYGFVSYDSFEASDGCLAAMNGQFLCNRPIHVSYAYKKDTKGERHGSAAERLIAANRPLERLLPHTNFANVPTPSAAPPPNVPGFGALPPIPPPPMMNGIGTGAGGLQPPPGAGMPLNRSFASPNASTVSGGSPFPPPPGMQTSPAQSGPNPGAPPGMPPLAGMGGGGNNRMPPPFPMPPNGAGMPTGMPPPAMFFALRPGMMFPPGMPPLPGSHGGMPHGGMPHGGMPHGGMPHGMQGGGMKQQQQS